MPMTDEELDRIELEAYLPSERDILALVAEVRRLRRENAAMYKALDWWRNHERIM